MELNEMEKKLLFQVEGDYQTKILNELYMTVRYSNNSEQREAAEGLMAKLRVLSNAECMDLVKDIQKNYRLPYPARTIGEKIAEARQQSGAEKLKGHDIMALERFDPEVRHMIVFDVLSYDSPVGDKGDKMRLFLTDAGYQKFLESQERGEVKLKNHAKVSDGHLHYDRRDHVGQFQVPVEQHEPTEEERIAAEKEAERLRRKRESNRKYMKKIREKSKKFAEHERIAEENNSDSKALCDRGLAAKNQSHVRHAGTPQTGQGHLRRRAAVSGLLGADGFLKWQAPDPIPDGVQNAEPVP